MSAPFTAGFQASYDKGLAGVGRLLVAMEDSAGAAQLEQARRLPTTVHPIVAVVGEAKRGKSSLVNVLLREPGLSPVGVVETTAAPICFRYAEQPGAWVRLSGDDEPFEIPVEELTSWATVAGAQAQRRAPTRTVDVALPIPLLQSFTLVDTPGLGGLTSAVGQLTLRSLASATVLLFVAEAHTELTSVELEFLTAAADRVDTVLIVLTGSGDLDRDQLELMLEEDRRRIADAVPRLAGAVLYPVDCGTALRALSSGEPFSDAAAARWERSGVAALEIALTQVTRRRGWSLLYLATLRLASTLLRRADAQLEERAAALDDPARLDHLVQERDRLTEHKRTMARVARAELNVTVNNARLDIGQFVARSLREVEEAHRTSITERRSELRALPEQMAADLERVCLDLSEFLSRLAERFTSDRLAELFTTSDLAQVTEQLGQRVLLLDGSARTLTVGNRDMPLTAVTSFGVAVAAGKVTGSGVGALIGTQFAAAGALAALPIVAAVGVGGLAAAALVKLRNSSLQRSEALGWLQRTMPDVRNELTTTAVARINEVQSAIALALEDVLDERTAALTLQIAQIERDRREAMGRPAALKTQRAAIATSLGDVDKLAELLRATPVAAPSTAAAPTGAAPRQPAPRSTR